MAFTRSQFDMGLSHLNSRNGVVNVRQHGVKGDARLIKDAVVTAGSGVVTSATGEFAQADVGKTAWVVYASGGYYAEIAKTTVVSVQSATQITLGANASNNYPNQYLFLGTDDTDRIINAYHVAKAARPRKDLYFPAGGYFFNRPIVYDIFDSLQKGVGIIGDGPEHTMFYPTVDYDWNSADHPLTYGQLAMLNVQYQVKDTVIGGFGMNLGNYAFNQNPSGNLPGGTAVVQNAATSWNSVAMMFDVDVRDSIGPQAGIRISSGNTGGYFEGHRLYSVGHPYATAIQVSVGSCVVSDLLPSNSNVGIWFYDVADSEMRGGLVDECTTYSMWLTKCNRLTLRPRVVYAGSGGVAIQISGSSGQNSNVLLDGGYILPYSPAYTNGSGVVIDQAGSSIRIQNATIEGRGTGKCINSNGTVVDCGGNIWTGDIVGTISAPNDYVS